MDTWLAETGGAISMVTAPSLLVALRAPTASPSSGPTSSAVAGEAGLSLGGTAITGPPPLLSGWACDHHSTGRHSVFGSYREVTEGPPAKGGNGLIEKLADAIEDDGGAPANSATVFYDKRCLNSGESWELGLKNGLEGSLVVMPLVSAAALQGMVEHASTRRDNLLWEWEIALERQRRGLCLVLPVFVQDVGADGKPRCVDFKEAAYPEASHFMSKISIRTTLVALFKINGVKLALDHSGAPDPAQKAEAVRQVRRLLGSQELRAMRHRAQQEYQDERGRKDQIWKHVEAILDGNDVIGRGASSVVYRGILDPTEPDDPPVAVKALKAEAVAASRQFTTELEIMKGLKVKNLDWVYAWASSFCDTVFYLPVIPLWWAHFSIIALGPVLCSIDLVVG